MAYQVADILSARGVPFVFVTGYEAELQLTIRFSGEPVLQKPIEQQMCSDCSVPPVLQHSLDIFARFEANSTCDSDE